MEMLTSLTLMLLNTITTVANALGGVALIMIYMFFIVLFFYAMVAVVDFTIEIIRHKSENE